ncbi:rRNA-processing protein [Saccharomycopsis crataegensis]|uniref:rRNA-processing protein n=1 Tax=Saccharomycopsis crataegensis TaxID=43959 RepID=A0AAV5QSY8_9ASCO|nr:rRNA-processing protein [Saccharomycopsis crataegensis]
MKIKTISRSSDTYIAERNTDESRISRNLNPALHPFERAREYQKALTATKMERMFAQPFVGQLGDGHRDAIYSIARNFDSLNKVASGSGDGVIKYWNLKSRKELVTFKAHYGRVSGLIVTPNGRLLSCGHDKTIKMWSVNDEDFKQQAKKLKQYDDNEDEESDFDDDESSDEEEEAGNELENGFMNENEINSSNGLIKTYLGEHSFESIDHHFNKDLFVTGGAQIELWDSNRSKPISNLTWGADNITTVRFNNVETSILASAGSDNTVILYDIRTNSPTQKIVNTLRTNAICFNPMSAYNFVCASEDSNVYGYDMRNMKRSTNVYKDHISAVLDVDFAPTGKELVTGSYDKTIRIFNVNEGHSREVYHTKRMQQVYCTKYSLDSKFIYSGSDDCNIRIWRAVAWERTNVKSTRERNKLEYDAKLKEKFKFMPEIRRISRHRHVPIGIKKDSEKRQIQTQSIKRRENNERLHSKKGSKPFKSEREKHIVANTYK